MLDGPHVPGALDRDPRGPRERLREAGADAAVRQGREGALEDQRRSVDTPIEEGRRAVLHGRADLLKELSAGLDEALPRCAGERAPCTLAVPVVNEALEPGLFAAGRV